MVTKKTLPISKIRIEKFLASSHFYSENIPKDFIAPFSLEDGLGKTIDHEFPKMITIKDIPNEKPYKVFVNYLQKAINKKQKRIEAINISSFNKETDEINSRLVNLKYIIQNKWYFFFKLWFFKNKRLCNL